jgi:hypothetical protein
VLVTDIDTDTADLELDWVVPNVHITVKPVLRKKHVLDVRGHNDHHRYFMVSDTRGNGSGNKVWTAWVNRLANISSKLEKFLDRIKPKSNWSILKKIRIPFSKPTRCMKETPPKSKSRVHFQDMLKAKIVPVLY